MIDESLKLNRNILCIDLKSFYASVECVLRGLDPYKTPLVVADKSRGGGSIVLAITPYLKNMGIPSRLRIFEIPESIKNIIYAKPRMQSYLEYATKVVEVYLEFISHEDLYVYSIDESFLDITHYLKYYVINEKELALRILNRIKEKLGLTATAGIGPNMLIAKVSMDLEAKKVEDNIANWTYNDIKEKLWNVEPLSKMWGIGHRMEKNLNELGLYKIGDIANYDKNKLKEKFGILGEELYYHTHGIDLSLIKDKDKLRKESKSVGISQVLFKDYDKEEIKTIIQEMVDDVSTRLRMMRKQAKTISLMIGYSKGYERGFSKQITLDYPTSSAKQIYKTCLDIYMMYIDDFPIRTVGISLTKLEEKSFYQYNLFESVDELDKEVLVMESLDIIKNKFGKNAVLRGNSLEKHSTVKMRNKQIGGHHV